ncbi:MAG: hypothetical protein HFG32_00765 [Eubacterium sp.]|nr:hypothetical protein [Eubacterium sp.]
MRLGIPQSLENKGKLRQLAGKLEFVDEFRLDSDSFETREEYEQYLEENGYTDEALMSLEEPEVFSRSRKSSKRLRR